ncbi:MAG: iron uptake transporter deferrochelatase/peroxidase subunit [Oligoflexia bacterium]|nr:iron uptake transporter deferrochelatase/peroxidase subunit [Oligoflexia bacterium]
MSKKPAQCPFSRRGFLAAAGSLVASMGCAHAAVAGGLLNGLKKRDLAPMDSPDSALLVSAAQIESFYEKNQGGIATAQQKHSYFAVLDLTTAQRSDVISLLKSWTEASARMTQGLTALPISQDLTTPGADSGEAMGLAPSRLTITFGFGAGLFMKDGQDRYGLAAQRPAAFVDLPAFNGDQLVDTKTGGDLSIQACADDPQIAFHAVRQLAQIAYGIAKIRWAQTGFMPNTPDSETPRNLMGFKDGIMNPQDLDQFVWVGSEGPAWMRGGSYAVIRRIRIALEHWDRTEVDFQEQVVGRHKYSGAPIGMQNETDALDLDAKDTDGNYLIAINSHVRLASPQANNGIQILRRGYSYNDGVDFTAERWPPWHQGMEYDAGLFFACYQRDPRNGFIPMFSTMAKLDALNQYTTHTGSGLFACPAGVAEGQYIGQGLFET